MTDEPFVELTQPLTQDEIAEMFASFHEAISDNWLNPEWTPAAIGEMVHDLKRVHAEFMALRFREDALVVALRQSADIDWHWLMGRVREGDPADADVDEREAYNAMRAIVAASTREGES